MLFNNKFILASNSPSRSKILKNNRLSFIKIAPLCEEEVLKKTLLKKKVKIQKISLELARLKSKSISHLNKNILVVGSDTVISLGGRLLNKASTLSEAKKKLQKLSGRTHYLFSSISIFYNNKEVWNITQKSDVKIRKLSEKDIDYYLSRAGKKILGAVGCYHVEGLGPNIIESLKGDLYNVMGFPLFPFLIFLKKYKKTNK